MTYTAATTIKGESRGSAGTIYQWALKNGCERPADVLAYLTTLYKICGTHGLRAEVIAAQSIHETTEGGSPWASYWWKQRVNPAGIGITGDPAQNNASRDFKTGDAAARAHFLHVWLYAVGATIPTGLSKSDDPRWQAAIDGERAGIAPTMQGFQNTWGMDDNYANAWLGRLNALESVGLLSGTPVKETPPVAEPEVGIGKGDTGAQSKTYAPVKLLPLLDKNAGKSVFERDAYNAYFGVNQEVTAIRDTPLLREAMQGSAETGDAKEGDKRRAGWAWVDKSGILYLYDDKGNRLLGKDWQTATGAIVVPDPSPLPPTPKPVPSDPKIITAANYRQVSDPQTLLPPIVWKGSPNFFPGRNGGKPVAIVYHITDDMNLNGTLSWFADNSSNASSHFVIDRDGTVYQCVSSLDGAWTNGDAQNWRSDITWLDQLIKSGANVNNFTISYEHVGKPSIPPTDAQYKSSIALSRYFCHPKVYGINPNRSHQLRHADVNGVTRLYCPGDDFQLGMIINELGGDPTEMVK